MRNWRDKILNDPSWMLVARNDLQIRILSLHSTQEEAQVALQAEPWKRSDIMRNFPVTKDVQFFIAPRADFFKLGKQPEVTE
jgi:hypothetical protein